MSRKIIENTKDFIISKVNSYVLKKFIFSNLIRLSKTLFAGAVVIILIIILEMSYHFGNTARSALFISAALAALLFMVDLLTHLYKTAKQYKTDKRKIVSQIDSEYPHLNLLMLHDLSSREENSVLIDFALKEMVSDFTDKKNKPIFFTKQPALASYARILTVVTAFFLITVINPAVSAAQRLIYYNRDYSIPPSHTLNLLSKDIVAAEKDSVDLTCRSSGKNPEMVTLRKRYLKDDVFVQKEILSAEDGLYKNRTAESSSFYYFFESEETVSDTGFVSVIKRPGISSVSFKVIAPRYTKISDREYNEVISKISLYKGSVVKFNIKPSLEELDSAFISFSNGGETELKRSSGGSYSCDLKFMSDSEFTFSLYASDKGLLLKNIDPVVQKIEIIKDEFPVVNFIFPEDGYLIDQSMKVPLLAAAADDFELSRASVFYRKLSFIQFAGKTEKSDYIEDKIPLIAGSDGIYAINSSFSCGGLNLLPEDKVELFIRVFDNDAVSGPKYTDSEVRTVMLPSMEQLLSGSEEKYQSQDRVLKNELEKNNAVIEKLSDIGDKLKKNQKLSWDDEKKLKQIAEDQERMNQTLDELKEDISKNISMLDENSIISEETMEKYLKLQELVDGIFPQEMREKLKKLSEMSEPGKFDKNKYSDLLNDFEQQQKQFGEELEKSIEILEQIKNEYMIDRLIRQIDDMVSKQNEVNISVSEEEFDAKKELAKEEKIESSYGYFEKELNKMKTGSDEIGIDELISKLEKAEVRKDFSDTKNSIGKNDGKSAKSKGMEITSELLNAKQSLTDLKKDMLDKQKKEMKKEIEEVISELLLISESVENIKNFSKDLSSGSSHSSEILKKFSRAESSFKTVTDKIFSISKRTFFIDNLTIGQIGRIQALFSQLSEFMINRQFSSSYDRNNNLMGGLNKLAVLLNDAKEEMDKSSSPSGMEEMLKKMEELARKQSELNSQTSSMGSSSGQMSMSQMQQMMSRLAMEQAQLYEALMKMQSQMQQPGKNGQPGDQGSPTDGMMGNMPGQNGKTGNSGSPKPGPGGEGDFMSNSGLGKKLGSAAESMKEAEKQLKDRKLDGSLKINQDQALDKLLDAIESVKREKYENKRESSSGNKLAVDPGRQIIKSGQDLREMMLRSLKDGYTNRYKIKIKNYFRELEN